MFTGIVEERGAVRSAGPGRLEVACRTVVEGSDVGSSVAVNGVCLTVVDRGEGRLGFDLSEETLRRTSLGRLREGDPVNLERPVTLSTRLGGHLVQGHVDGVGTITALERSEDGATVVVRPQSGLERYLAEKGSVAVDGVSLTVARLHEGAFEVALIPHTLEATTFGSAAVGDPVNLEVDVIAKYVERLMQGRSA
jgi:riboflavin synthase